MKVKTLGTCLAILCILAAVPAASCGGPPPEGSIIYQSSKWGDTPSGSSAMFRQLQIEATVQNVGGDGTLWVNVEINEKNLLMEGSGVQSIKVFLARGEEKTYKFNFWINWTKQSSFSVWCSDKEPQQVSPDLGSLHILILDKEDAPIDSASVVSENQPADQPQLSGSTGADGKIDFNNIQPGIYNLLITRTGLQSVQYDVTITKGMLTSLTFNLVRTFTETYTVYETETGLEP
jgi:Carboxypeptidase regulatory-like domain